MQNDLISRSALIEQLKWLATHEDAFRQSCILGIVHTIAKASAVDAVEVVRCKDCGERNEFGRCNCITGRNIYAPVGDDFFCGYGERRADDD